jgi:hypothetical protein
VSDATDLRSLVAGCGSFDPTFVAEWPISPATRQLLFAEVDFNESDDDDDDDDETLEEEEQ